MSALQSFPYRTCKWCASPSRNVSSQRCGPTSCMPVAMLSALSSSHDPSVSARFIDAYHIKPTEYMPISQICRPGRNPVVHAKHFRASPIPPSSPTTLHPLSQNLPSNPALAEHRAARFRSWCTNGESRRGKTAGSSDARGSGSCASQKRGRRRSPRRRRARSGTRSRSCVST